MRYFKGVVPYLSCLFAEDSAKQSFLCGKLCFSLWSYLTYEDIARMYLCTDADDTVLVKVFKSVLADIGDISCYLLGSELGFSCLCFEVFDVDRCILILFYKVLVEQYGVLVVIAFPGHEADKRVLTE